MQAMNISTQMVVHDADTQQHTNAHCELGCRQQYGAYESSAFSQSPNGKQWGSR